MNGSTDFVSHYAEFLSDKLIEKYNVTICAPYIYLQTAINLLKNKNVTIFAQDVSEFINGAYTSQVSANMLKDIGVSGALIGHSETRQLLKYNNNSIQSKTLNAINYDLSVIFCIGEDLEVRNSGKYLDFLKQQLSFIPFDKITEKGKFYIAYEPIWAIGTGMTASLEMISEVFETIRQYCLHNRLEKVDILYGGSVNLSNIQDLLAQDYISGLLIGGMSLKIDDVNKI